MHSLLHVAACYLDPILFGVARHQDEEVMSGLYEATGGLNLDPSIAALVRSQLKEYSLEERIFGTKANKYARVESVPTIWWNLYASRRPKLKTFAIRVLS
jgi:hypothetical protein